MGNIKLKIRWGQKDISEFNRNIPVSVAYAALEKKYRFDLIQQIDFDGDDLELSIDIESLDGEIDWDSIQLPNSQIRIIIKDFERYYEISVCLRQVLGRISDVTFEKRYNLNRLGDEALEIISSFKPSEYFKEIAYLLTISKEEIKHTLNQEINKLTNMKQKASQIDKDDALRDAIRHLTQDVNTLKNCFEAIELK